MDLSEEWENCKNEFEFKNSKFGQTKDNEDEIIPEGKFSYNN